jgi:hypothetical protein
MPLTKMNLAKIVISFPLRVSVPLWLVRILTNTKHHGIMPPALAALPSPRKPGQPTTSTFPIGLFPAQLTLTPND